MKIAVEGCLHGELERVYETLEFIEQKKGIKVELLLCCGDFQSVRNHGDLQGMAVPQKYQVMGDFHKYYSGEKVAPVLTVFIGGNHEASSYLQELPYGGWVAKNIYYLGYAGVIQIGGIRIGGLSGIYKSQDYIKGHFEHPPYNESSKRSVYHIRNLEVFRLKQITQPVDIFMSHDWPQGITDYGNVNCLYTREKKGFLRADIESGRLGSPPAMDILQKIQPQYWFSAHLHCKFPANVQHKNGNTTKFLALDKCLPRRKFLQVLDVPHDSSKTLKLHIDPEWFSILKSTNHLLNTTHTATYLPGPNRNDKERHDFSVNTEAIEEMKADLGGILELPENFQISAPVYNPRDKHQKCDMYINPQTSLICSILELSNPYESFLSRSPLGASFTGSSSQESDVSHGDITFIDSDTSNTSFTTSHSLLHASTNPEEISLQNIDEEFDSNDSDNDHTAGDVDISKVKLTIASPYATSSPIVMSAKSKRISLSLPAPVQSLDRLAHSEATPCISNSDIDTDISISNNSSDTSLPNLSKVDIIDISPVRKTMLTDVVIKSDGCANPISSDTPESSQTDEEGICPKPKKFKRRNQSIYTEAEDSN